MSNPSKPWIPTTGRRYYRAIEIMEHANLLLGSTAATLEWLRSPQRALGFRVPLELLATKPGADAVEDSSPGSSLANRSISCIRRANFASKSH